MYMYLKGDDKKIFKKKFFVINDFEILIIWGMFYF